MFIRYFRGFVSRIGVLLLWLARLNLFEAAFGGNWWLPVPGILLLPFTTLMYTLLWSPGVGLTGFDWLWLILALLLDLGSFGSSGYANRERYYGGRATDK